MFTKIQLPSDSQLTHHELANSLVNETIEQLMRLSNLPREKCETLVSQQFLQPQKSYLFSEKKIENKPVISGSEADYIYSLFS